MKVKSIPFSIFGFLAFAAASHAATLYSTTFSAAGGYTTGNLVGQNSWAAISGAGTQPIQVSTTTNLVTIQAISGEDANVGFSPVVASAGESVTLSLLNLTISAAGAGSYFTALGASAGSTNYTGRLFAQATTGGYFLGIQPSSTAPATYGTTVLSFGTAYSVAVNYGFVDGTGNDTLAVSVDGANYATYGGTFDFGVGTGGSGTFGSVLLRQDNTSGTAFTLGGIEVSSTIPEPTTALLGGLGMLGMLRRRR